MDAEKIACPECGKAINARFAACPMCGAQIRERAVVRPTPLDAPGGQPTPPSRRVAVAASDLGLTPEEERVTGSLSAIRVAVVPSRHTRGWMRYADIALTVFAFPFILASMFGILFQGVKRWGKVDALEWLTGLLFGVPLLGLILYITTGFSFSTLTAIVGVSLGAWVARGVLRWIAKAARLSDHE